MLVFFLGAKYSLATQFSLSTQEVIKMIFSEFATFTKPFLPIAICSCLGIFAILGIGELLKETSIAFKRGVKA
tara:strand:+ start:289 stop:507 length:219 start_codon:yes stop_codon:yes gene_type:complete